MARPLRIAFPGALYRVTSRADRREAIYEDDANREAFLDVLAETVARYKWICRAYCLMTNHYHIAIETVDGNLSKGMRHFESPSWSRRTSLPRTLQRADLSRRRNICRAHAGTGQDPR